MIKHNLGVSVEHTFGGHSIIEYFREMSAAI